MMKWSQPIGVVVLLTAVVMPTTVHALEQARGRTPLDAEDAHRTTYRQKWALIIGINYDDPGRPQQNRIKLPTLRNAESDAKAVRDILISHYGYMPENIYWNTSGAEATLEWIRDRLRDLCDPDRITADDSVLVYFAGHGDRIETAKERGVLFPFDVQFAGGQPVANTYLRLQSDLVDIIDTSPARHKLIILDSCYSGEIFNIGVHPISKGDRSSQLLFEIPGLQAMASCHGSQVAADGRGTHSPFTRVLLEALKQVPARDPNLVRLPVNRLFATMRPDLVLPNGQAPDCRNLAGDGEFSFFPDRSKDFEQFLPDTTGYQMLQISAGSEQGQWWFEEVPWFSPSIRAAVLKRLVAQRSGIDQVRIAREDLKVESRRWALEQLESSLATAPAVETGGDTLELLRARHTQLLTDASGRGEIKLALETAISDLQRPEITPRLAAEDWHFLAVANHGLGRPEAEQAYQRALDLYQEREVTGQGTDPSVAAAQGRALHALCKADYAEFLFRYPSAQFGSDGKLRSAKLFREAHDDFQWQGPESFRVFVRCREADAWLALNRWADARFCLQDALDLATSLGPHHFLTAFVHRRQAWAEMSMWKVSEAELSFAESNRILAMWMSSSAPELTDTSEVDGREAMSGSAEGDVDAAFAVDDRVRNSTDHQARIAYFHNLHGLAMAQRLRGRTALAAQKYRWLAMELENALGQLRDTRQSFGNVSSNVELQLQERLINTLERLGDCNLFGDPGVRNLSEAIDDYDRANSHIHRLAAFERQQWQAKLLYKRALAISLPSEFQNPDLALQMCEQADRLFKDRSADAKGLEQALGCLTTPVVALLAANPRPVLAPDGENEALAAAREGLRKVLYEYRDQVGQKPHRDQLELCLFAADVLVQHGMEPQELEALNDVDLLLSFCRIPLAPYRHGGKRSPGSSDAAKYLRPYYDTAIARLLETESMDARKLIRIHWEATRGTVCPKPEQPVPVFALYILHNRPYLFYNLPGVTCRAVDLSDEVSCDELVAVSQDATLERLRLPRAIERELREYCMRSEISLTADDIEFRPCHEMSSDRTVVALKPAEVGATVGSNVGDDVTDHVEDFLAPFDFHIEPLVPRQ